MPHILQVRHRCRPCVPHSQIQMIGIRLFAIPGRYFHVTPDKQSVKGGEIFLAAQHFSFQSAESSLVIQILEPFIGARPGGVQAVNGFILLNQPFDKFHFACKTHGRLKHLLGQIQ